MTDKLTDKLPAKLADKMTDKPLRLMKEIRFISLCLLACLLVLAGCKDDGEEVQPTEFTGRSVSYLLASGSDFNYHGTALFEEKNDGSTLISIQLEGVESSGEVYFPVHLHTGAFENSTGMGAMLTSVDARDGKSTTHLQVLGNGDPVSYEELLDYDGHIRVHLGESGDDRAVILAYGNIGRHAAR